VLLFERVVSVLTEKHAPTPSRASATQTRLPATALTSRTSASAWKSPTSPRSLGAGPSCRCSPKPQQRATSSGPFWHPQRRAGPAAGSTPFRARPARPGSPGAGSGSPQTAASQKGPLAPKLSDGEIATLVAAVGASPVTPWSSRLGRLHRRASPSGNRERSSGRAWPLRPEPARLLLRR
jgi:hypothetical protein